MVTLKSIAFIFSIFCIVIGLSVGPSPFLVLLGILIITGLIAYLIWRAGQIPTNVQNIVFERDGGRCNTCGTTENVVFDRITPRGGNKENNIQLLCRTCRQLKQHMEKLNDPLAEIRKQAVLSLTKFLDEAILERIELRGSRHREVLSLTEFRDEWAVPAIIRMLNDPDTNIRWQTVFVLRNLRDKRAIEPLYATFMNDPDPAVRKAAVIALAACGDTTVRDRLAELCKDKHVFIKNAAALALGELGDTRAKRYLVRLTFDDDEQLRMRAHQLVSELDKAKSKRVSPNRNIPKDVKDAVWERDEGQCVVCGATTGLHFDHDLPLSLGGGNQVENIQLLCKDCNLKKGNKIM